MKRVFTFGLLVFLCFSIFLFSGCDAPKASYTVNAYVNGAIFGEVYGGNETYESGSTVSLTAIPRQKGSQTNENVFVAWVHDFKVVSTDANYTFVVDKDTSGNYIALFQNSQSDLEYIAPLGISLEYGMFSDSDIDVKSYTLSMGYYEDELFEFFAGEAEDNGFANIDNIYEVDELPYAFDKTKDLYIKVQINYQRDDFNYTATAIKKIDKVNLGQMPTIEINEEFTEAVLDNTDVTLGFATKPKLDITLERISNLVVEEEE